MAARKRRQRLNSRTKDLQHLAGGRLRKMSISRYFLAHERAEASALLPLYNAR
jgi:hypothetical protein